MTKRALPDLLDLAESVADGTLRADDAEMQVRAARGPERGGASEKAVRDLRNLIVAASAVRSHARATREASTTQSPDLAQAGASIQTIVPGRVRAGAARRRTSRGGGPSPRRTWLLVAATIAIGAGAVGISLIGGQVVLPGPTPTTPAVVTNPTAVASPSAVRSASGLIAFAENPQSGPQSGAHLWVANADGTGKHELSPGGCQGMPSWSPDGTRLLISRIEHPVNVIDQDPCGFFTDLGDAGTRLYLTDASGNAPQLVDTGCVSPCVSDSRGVFSSDGRRILFVRENDVVEPSATPAIAGKPAPSTREWVLTEMDLASGRITELAELSRSSPPSSQSGPPGPNWSPDRTQFVFGLEVPMPDPEIHFTSASEVLVAAADGRNVRQLIPSGSFGAWSPDGSRILFQGERYSWVGNVSSFSSDIYTVRPDGTDLRRLTTDETSTNPAWSVDGRIWFIRGGAANWIMDADGGNAAQSSHAPEPQDLAGTARQPTP